MASSGAWRRVALVKTVVSEDRIAFIISVTSMRGLGTTLVTASVVPSSPILVPLIKELLSSSETAVFTSATQLSISVNAILQLYIYSPKRKST
jgi:hypothetical protein